MSPFDYYYAMGKAHTWNLHITLYFFTQLYLSDLEDTIIFVDFLRRLYADTQ